MERSDRRALSRLPRLLLTTGLAATLSLFPLAVAPPAFAATSQVRIVDNAYEPATITVNLGDTVRWTNSGREAHTVTSEVRIWDSRSIPAGGTYELVFPRPGTYYYYCTLHPQMRGQVVVASGVPRYGTGSGAMTGYGAASAQSGYGYAQAHTAYGHAHTAYAHSYAPMSYPRTPFGSSFGGAGYAACPLPYGQRHGYPGYGFCVCR